MIITLYKSPSLSPLIAPTEHKEKQFPSKIAPYRIKKIENNLLPLLIAQRERFLFRTTRKHPCLKSVYRCAVKEGHEGRCQAIGIAVTSVDDIFKNTKLRGTATRICQKTPLNNKLPQEKDPAIALRGKKFIETFLVHKTPLDEETYITALGIGYQLKRLKFDPPLTDMFAHVWHEREQLLTPLAVTQSKAHSRKQR
ncbi:MULTISPECIES: hypothetical protein [unclassified Symbiopectobacterium]|uniref:hypothetical protein n=1 Tax=unclassified Symbiopectobacterium TaxID=2794573 RepID=UPI002227DD5E|nr:MULTISPECIES: hypothetical protein [unclassified Symbiopectobacterium]MCW2475154.1 hypothetical protein [Candidatus Symbiopectobacterium sp. NZEC151]MCW2482275.1 hypothetical protein [Candidatus Symbiopectobacterium sp. NZEC135]